MTSLRHDLEVGTVGERGCSAGDGICFFTHRKSCTRASDKKNSSEYQPGKMTSGRRGKYSNLKTSAIIDISDAQASNRETDRPFALLRPPAFMAA